jgi:hypothetical protein
MMQKKFRFDPIVSRKPFRPKEISRHQMMARTQTAKTQMESREQ